ATRGENASCIRYRVSNWARRFWHLSSSRQLTSVLVVGGSQTPPSDWFALRDAVRLSTSSRRRKVTKPLFQHQQGLSVTISAISFPLLRHRPSQRPYHIQS